MSWFARRLTDIIPNSWQASRISQRLVDNLREADLTDEKIYGLRSYLIEKLREHVTAQIEKQAEKVFSNKILNGVIRFDLQQDSLIFKLWIKLKYSYQRIVHCWQNLMEIRCS